MADIPKLLNKIVKKNDGRTIQFVTAWTLAARFLAGSFIMAPELFRMTFVSKDALVARIWFGLIGVFPVAYFFVLGIPRSLTVDFENQSFESVMGFGPLGHRRKGSLDEIKFVYFTAHNDVFRIGLSFGTTNDNPQAIMLALPRCDITTFYRRDATLMWGYAKQLAERIGVPCEAVNWSIPDGGAVGSLPDGLPVH